MFLGPNGSKIQRKDRTGKKNGGGGKGNEGNEGGNNKTRKKITPQPFYCRQRNVMLKEIKITSTKNSACKKIKYNKNKNSPKINEVRANHKAKIFGNKYVDNNKKRGVKKLFFISGGQSTNRNMKGNEGMYRDEYSLKGNEICSTLLLLWWLHYTYVYVVLGVLISKIKDLMFINWLGYTPECEVLRRGYRIRRESIHVLLYEEKVSEKRAARNICCTVIKRIKIKRKIRIQCYDYVEKNLFLSDVNLDEDSTIMRSFERLINPLSVKLYC
jgi:hypothetical protein